MNEQKIVPGQLLRETLASFWAAREMYAFLAVILAIPGAVMNRMGFMDAIAKMTSPTDIPDGAVSTLALYYIITAIWSAPVLLAMTRRHILGPEYYIQMSPAFLFNQSLRYLGFSVLVLLLTMVSGFLAILILGLITGSSGQALLLTLAVFVLVGAYLFFNTRILASLASCAVGYPVSVKSSFEIMKPHTGIIMSCLSFMVIGGFLCSNLLQGVFIMIFRSLGLTSNPSMMMILEILLAPISFLWVGLMTSLHGRVLILLRERGELHQ